MGNETMKRRRVDRVRVKGDKGIAPTILIIVLAIALLIIMLFVIPWINLQIRCGDCSDVKTYTMSGGSTYWKYDGDMYLPFEIEYKKGSESPWRVITHDLVWTFYTTLDELKSDIPNLEVDEDMAYHIIDCIERECK